MKRVIKKKNTGGAVQHFKLREWLTDELGTAVATTGRPCRRWRPAWTLGPEAAGAYTHQKAATIVTFKPPTRKPNAANNGAMATVIAGGYKGQ